MTINQEYPAKSISYGATRSLDSIKYIVYHYTGNTTDTAKANARYFSAGGSNTRKAGAHYFVDGTSVYQSIADNKSAYAVGVNYGGRMFGTVNNSNSISIEMCSTSGSISPNTIENAVWLGKKLMKKYGIDIKHVVRHWDVCAKQCPGWSGWCGDNASKWMALKAKLQSKNVTYATTTEETNLHSMASKDSRTVGSIKSGVKFAVIAKTPNWYEVALWIPKKDIESTSDSKIKVSVDTNARLKSGKANDVVGTVYKNTSRTVQDKTDNWVKVYAWLGRKHTK